MSCLRDFHPPWLAQSLVGHTFIETGTYHGATLLEAKKQPFKRLVTIDVDEVLLSHAREAVGFDARVQFICGSSPDWLPQVMRPDESTTFWLDAHYTGHSRAWMDAEYGECPLLAELTAITAVRWTTPPKILIDDAHMYTHAWWLTDPLAERFTRSHWPTVAQIQKLLPEFQIFDQDGVLYAIVT